jgi:hypothetical protein
MKFGLSFYALLLSKEAAAMLGVVVSAERGSRAHGHPAVCTCSGVGTM